MSFTRYVKILANIGIIIFMCCNRGAFAAQSDELFTCGFENTGFCSMELGSTGDFQWTKHSGLSSHFSGPEFAYSGDYYIHLNAKYNYPAKTAIIKTAPLGFSGAVCVSFAYNMLGPDIGSLRAITTDPTESIFFKQGNQGYLWRHIQLDAIIHEDSRIKYEGLTGNGPLGYIALDEIHVARGRCEPQDIDECATGRHGCPQRCTNTYGSYHCTCKTGYSSMDGGKTCQGCADEYQQVLESSKAFTSTCPVVQELMQMELDGCFRKACEGATVNMVTYRSPVCVLRLCQPGEYQLKPSVGILGWDIYLRNMTPSMEPINEKSFPLWQILVGLVGGVVVLVTLAVVIGIKRRRMSNSMDTAGDYVRRESDPDQAPPGGQGGDAIYDEITEITTLDGTRGTSVVFFTGAIGAAFYQNRMTPPIDNDPDPYGDTEVTPSGDQRTDVVSSYFVTRVESTDSGTNGTTESEFAGSPECGGVRIYHNINFSDGDRYEKLTPTKAVDDVQ